MDSRSDPLNMPDQSSSSDKDCSLVILDSGDVKLFVTRLDECRTCTASSMAMSLASPVWNKILNSPFRVIDILEKDPRGREVSFEDDNVDSLLILLHIAHLQFNKVPPSLDFQTLLNLAVLCDKYDCVKLIRPWLPGWLKDLEPLAQQPGYEEWLFVAWVLGEEATFETLAKKLVLEMRTNDEGVCLTEKGDAFPSLMPPDIVESILSNRLATIGKLLNVVYDHIRRFTSNERTICFDAQHKEECDALVLGSLIRGLVKLSLWPEQDPNAIHINVKELESRLTPLTIFTYTSYTTSPDPYVYGNYQTTATYGHTICNFGYQIKGAISSTISSIPTPVLESHRRHMKFQRET